MKELWGPTLSKKWKKSFLSWPGLNHNGSLGWPRPIWNSLVATTVWSVLIGTPGRQKSTVNTTHTSNYSYCKEQRSILFQWISQTHRYCCTKYPAGNLQVIGHYLWLVYIYWAWTGETTHSDSPAKLLWRTQGGCPLLCGIGWPHYSTCPTQFWNISRLRNQQAQKQNKSHWNLVFMISSDLGQNMICLPIFPSIYMASMERFHHIIHQSPRWNLQLWCYLAASGKRDAPWDALLFLFVLFFFSFFSLWKL